MIYVQGKEKDMASSYINEAISIARLSKCMDAHCGSIIVNGGEIIGKGYNSPAGNVENQKRCGLRKDSYSKKVTDKTCCVHAEQRAIMDALRNNPEKIAGSRLYFIRVDEKGDPVLAGKPYCTICSKMALDSGVKEFVLLHEEGIAVYDTGEYNHLSYQFTE